MIHSAINSAINLSHVNIGSSVTLVSPKLPPAWRGYEIQRLWRLGNSQWQRGKIIAVYLGGFVLEGTYCDTGHRVQLLPSLFGFSVTPNRRQAADKATLGFTGDQGNGEPRRLQIR